MPEEKNDKITTPVTQPPFSIPRRRVDKNYLQIPTYRCAGNKKLFARLTKIINARSKLGLEASYDGQFFILKERKKV